MLELIFIVLLFFVGFGTLSFMKGLEAIGGYVQKKLEERHERWARIQTDLTEQQRIEFLRQSDLRMAEYRQRRSIERAEENRLMDEAIARLEMRVSIDYVYIRRCHNALNTGEIVNWKVEGF